LNARDRPKPAIEDTGETKFGEWQLIGKQPFDLFGSTRPITASRF
jgi:hypothetical protein